MSDLRIFSYLPNPRIWKATIAARLTGVALEIRGAKPGELADWLWDFDARPLSDKERAAAADLLQVGGRTGFTGTLFKTQAFLDAQPFGTVPAAFSPDGRIGIFESNSIMRAVARLGADAFPLYGRDAYTASRIDGFLDAALVFARDSQIFLLALRGDGPDSELHARTRRAFDAYMAGIERALAPDRRFLVGDDVTLADICFAAELTLFANERVRSARLAERGLQPILPDADSEYPQAMAHYQRLCAHPAFAPDIGPYLSKLSAAETSP